MEDMGKVIYAQKEVRLRNKSNIQSFKCMFSLLLSAFCLFFSPVERLSYDIHNFKSIIYKSAATSLCTLHFAIKQMNLYKRGRYLSSVIP